MTLWFIVGLILGVLLASHDKAPTKEEEKREERYWAEYTRKCEAYRAGRGRKPSIWWD